MAGVTSRQKRQKLHQTFLTFLEIFKFSSLIIMSEKFEAIKYPHLHSKKIDPICSTKP